MHSHSPIVRWFQHRHRFAKGREAALDHVVVRRETGAKVPWCFEDAPGYDEYIAISQFVEKPVAISTGRTGEQIESSPGPNHFVAVPGECVEEPIAPRRKRVKVYAE